MTCRHTHHRHTILIRLACCSLACALALADRETDEFNFAEGLFVHRDYRSAVEEFQAFLKAFPKSTQAALARYRIGECYLRLDDHEKAVAAFEAALQAHPDAKEAPLGSYNLARSRLRLKQTDKALEAFRTAAEKGTGQVREEALVGAGECLIDLKQYKEAAETYTALIGEFPKTKHRPAALFSLGWTRSKLEQHKEAVDAFSTLVREFPEHETVAKAKLALSDAYVALGEHAKSAEVLQGLAGAGDVAQDVMLRQAWNQFKSGDKKAAAQTFATFATSFPTNAQAASARFNAGIAAFDTADYPGAAQHFEHVLRDCPKAPECVEARYWRGLCLFKLAQHAEAEKTLKPLIDDPNGLSPDKRELLECIYGQALAKTDQHANAIAQFRQFLERAPDSQHAPTATYALAQSLHQTEQLQEATAVLEKLLVKLPDSPLRQNALFAAGEYLYRLKASERALPYLEELVKRDANAPNPLYRLAWVYHDLQRFEEACARFGTLAELASPFKNEAQFMCGRAAEQLKQTERAVTAYERLTAAETTDPFVEKAIYHLAFLYEGDKAEQNLARYQKRFPKGKYTDQVRLRMAESTFAGGDTDRAAALYQQLLDAGASPAITAAANYGSGWCLLKQGHMEEADARFATVIAAPEATADAKSDASLQRGEIAYRGEKFREARACFEAVQDDETRGERALYMLGWCARKLGEADAEQRWFSEAVKRYPKGRFHADSTLRLAELLNRRAESAAARDLLAGMVDGVPAELKEDLLHAYCEALVGVKDWKAVLKHSLVLRQGYPKSDRAYLVSFRLGVAYQALGLLDEAEKDYRETVALTDTIEAAKAQFNLASIYFSRKDYLAAAKNFLRVQMLYDYGDLAPKSLYHAVDAFRRAGEARRADLYLSKLKDEYPDSEWSRKAAAAGGEQ